LYLKVGIVTIIEVNALTLPQTRPGQGEPAPKLVPSLFYHGTNLGAGSPLARPLVRGGGGRAQNISNGRGLLCLASEIGLSKPTTPYYEGVFSQAI
jgi:hypothetical protein